MLHVTKAGHHGTRRITRCYSDVEHPLQAVGGALLGQTGVRSDQ